MTVLSLLTEDCELAHKYCRNSCNGLKDYYTLLQIAHAINQLVEKSKLVKEYLELHFKETIRNIWCNLCAYMLYIHPIMLTQLCPKIYHIQPILPDELNTKQILIFFLIGLFLVFFKAG